MADKTFASQRSIRGFTLIELLVVMLILSILMAIGLPLYLHAVSDANKRVCRTNMQTIANAVQAKRVRDRANDYSLEVGQPIDSNHEPDLQAVPRCADGGQYSVETGSTGDNKSYKIRCSIADHGTFEPGVDNT